MSRILQFRLSRLTKCHQVEFISSPNVRCGSPRATCDNSVVSWLEYMPMQHDLATQNVRRSTQGGERVDPRSPVEQRNGSIEKPEAELQNPANCDPLNVVKQRRSEVLKPADKI